MGSHGVRHSLLLPHGAAGTGHAKAQTYRSSGGSGASATDGLRLDLKMHVGKEWREDWKEGGATEV